MTTETIAQFKARGGEIVKYPVTFNDDTSRHKWTNKGDKGSAESMRKAHQREYAVHKGSLQYGQHSAGFRQR